MEKLLMYSHVFSGATVLLLGLINIVGRKGTKNHILLGRIYVTAMFWICASAMGIVLFYRFNFFLTVVAIISFHTTFVGLRVLKRKKIGEERWYDWMVSIITALFGIGLMVYAIHIFLSSQNTFLGILSSIFGVVTFSSGLQDIRFFLKPKTDEKRWWLYQHIGSIGGSYIAAITAFAVQNGRIFIPDSSYQWLLWVLPGIIGVPIISLAISRYRKKTSPPVATFKLGE